MVDIDLASFFDEVNHDLLMARVRRRVKDVRMLKLIRAFLNSSVMIGGVSQPTEKGTIYVGSRRSGERVLQSLTQFLEGKMKLKVNRAKSAVDRPVNRVFLGYSFTVHRQTKIRVPEKTRQRCERR